VDDSRPVAKRIDGGKRIGILQADIDPAAVAGRPNTVRTLPDRNSRDLCEGIAAAAGGTGLAERQAHCGDLLPLLNDNFLCDVAQPLIRAIATVSDGHVDGALVVRDHHGGKIPIDIPVGGLLET
jgi:hypothetical protein